MTIPPVIRYEGLDELVTHIDQYRKQVPFAASLALNRVADEINATLRQEVPKRFTIREPALLRHLAPRDLPRHQRATKERLTATIMTAELSAMLGPFEAGEPHVRSLRRPVIVPTTSLRPGKRSKIPRTLYPVNLGLQPRRDAAGSLYYALGRGSRAKSRTPFKQGQRGWSIQGKLGTFALDPKYHPGITKAQAGVYQRLGGSVRKLWHYVDRVQRPASLQYHATADRIMESRFNPNFDGALQFAFRTAKR